MRKIVALTAVSAAALFASPASAQAVSGPRIGVLGGFDHVKIDQDLDSPQKWNDDGLVYGLAGGYDFAVGPSFSVGIDLEGTQTSVDAIVTPGAVVNRLRTRYEVDGGLDLYIGGRATLAATENINFYLKGGYSHWKVEESVYTVQATTAAGLDPVGTVHLIERDKSSLGGWRVGAGLEFTNGFFYGGPEYRYSNYEKGVTRHQLVLNAGVRFGPRAEPLPPPVVEAPPPPPPPPATQTCPDGSVILATEVCPAPPPPPPPPPPAPERG